MELPRGMKDFENSEFLEIEFIRKKFLEISEIFNFKLMEPSPLELLSTLEAKGGETLRDDVYFFKDKGEREIALRFDFTIGLTRFIASQKSFKLPAKISSFGGVWRYDEPQKGRYRFFHQFDIEIFGKVNLEHDAEIIEFDPIIVLMLQHGSAIHNCVSTPGSPKASSQNLESTTSPSCSQIYCFV